MAEPSHVEVTSPRLAVTTAWELFSDEFRRALEDHLREQDERLQLFFDQLARDQVICRGFDREALDDPVPSEKEAAEDKAQHEGTWLNGDDVKEPIAPGPRPEDSTKVEGNAVVALASLNIEDSMSNPTANRSLSKDLGAAVAQQEQKLQQRHTQSGGAFQAFLNPWAARNARLRHKRFLRANEEAAPPPIMSSWVACRVKQLSTQLMSSLSWAANLEEPERTSCLAAFIQDPIFVSAVVCAIVANTAYTTYSANYEMETLGQEHEYHQTMEAVFLGVFVLELLLKLFVHRLYFFVNEDWHWNCFDFLICATSACDVLGLALPVGGVSFARSLRVLRVAKILRVIRMLRFLREVRIMLICMMGSIVSLFWAFVMLVFTSFLFALFFMQEMAPYLAANAAVDAPDKCPGGPEDPAELWACQRYYFRTIFSTMHVLGMASTGGKDWEEVWKLISPVGWDTAGAFLFYMVFFMFAVMNIITGVFVEHASILSKPDDEEAMLEHMRQLRSDVEYLTAIMELIDKDKSGFISVREFLTAMQNERIEYSLRSIGVDMRMPERYFTTLASLSDKKELSIKELVYKIVDMKGSASRADVELLSLETRILKREVTEMFAGKEFASQNSLSCLAWSAVTEIARATETERALQCRGAMFSLAICPSNGARPLTNRRSLVADLMVAGKCMAKPSHEKICESDTDLPLRAVFLATAAEEAQKRAAEAEAQQQEIQRRKKELEDLEEARDDAARRSQELREEQRQEVARAEEERSRLAEEAVLQEGGKVDIMSRICLWIRMPLIPWSMRKSLKIAKTSQIRWANPRVASALEELRSLPEADGDLLALDSELLAAAFLARCDFDVTRAREAIAHTAAWRKQSGASEVRKKLLEEPKMSFSDFPHGPAVLKHFPQCEGGAAVDKRGLPYAIRCVGIADAVGLFSVITEDEMLQFQTHLCEWRLLQLEDFARATGQLTGLLIVQDMFAPNGLLNAWRKHGSKSKIMRRLTSMMDEHYPGVMESVLLVNAPWAMHAILRILTPLLPQRVVKKLQVVPMAQTPERLQQLVDESNLPEFLGGSAADAEFVPARAALVANGSGSELFIKAGQTEERSLDLQQGDIAAFGLSVANGLDILFACHFESEEEAVEEVFTARRLQEESSSFSAPRDGRLVLTFDNSYSWVKPKDVRFELSKLLAEALKWLPVCRHCEDSRRRDALYRFRGHPRESVIRRAEWTGRAAEEARGVAPASVASIAAEGLEQQAERLVRERQEQEEQTLLQASRHEEESRKRQEDLDRRKAELQQLEDDRETGQEQHDAEEKAASDRHTRARFPEAELADQQAHLEAQRKEVESCRQRGEVERDAQLQALQQHEAELKKHPGCKGPTGARDEACYVDSITVDL
ncbi:SFH12 [Symbiodinium sp. CCMP2456]|nr:SFH12 [Symbiodinium sp. CCMP2456]